MLDALAREEDADADDDEMRDEIDELLDKLVVDATVELKEVVLEV